MEERAGERRHVFVGTSLSSLLSPFLRRGERKKQPRSVLAEASSFKIR